MTAAPATFAGVFVALYAAHQVGDHWVQTHHQAQSKGARTWAGRAACSAHVATLTLTKCGSLVLLMLSLDLRLSVVPVVIGLTVDALSHYWADRRFTLAALARATGSAAFYTLGAPRPGRDDNPSLGTGAYALDQSWHVGWLFVTALIIAN